MFPNVNREKPPQLNDQQILVLNSGQKSRTYNIMGSIHDIFNEFVVLNAVELGVPIFASANHAIWEIGSLQDRTLIVVNITRRGKYGILRIVGGGAKTDDILNRFHYRLQAILSLMADDFRMLDL